MGGTTSEIQSRLLQLYLSKMSTKKQLSISDFTDRSGWESNVFSFTLNYEEDSRQIGEALLLKMYPGKSGANKAIGEFYGLQQLTLEGYPVPEVLSIGLEKTPFGKPYVIMEQVPGQLLLDALRQASSDEQKTLLRYFCQLFVELHNIDWRQFVIDPTQYQPHDFIQRTLSANCAFVTQHCPGMFDLVLDWLYKHSLEVTCEHLSVIHGDYHPGNIILKEDGAACVIDWTQAEVSDYRFDLAWTLLLLSTFGGPEQRRDVLGGYEYYAGYHIPHLDFFEVAVCLKRLFDMTLCLDDEARILAAPSATRIRAEQNMLSVQAALALLELRTGITLPALADRFCTL